MALIQITDLTFAYPGSFDNVFEHVSFQFDTCLLYTSDAADE